MGWAGLLSYVIHLPGPPVIVMDALVSSFSMVTLAEIGDKTQLLSIILAVRFRSFWPIFFGVLTATLLNHAMVAWLGAQGSDLLSPYWLEFSIALLFIAVGIWALIPDKEPTISAPTGGAFITSCIAFFLAEMGDKTQLATLTLGARYVETWQVIIGTTLGMLAANAPAILFGEQLLRKIPMQLVRIIACAMFLAFGTLGLLKWMNS